MQDHRNTQCPNSKKLSFSGTAVLMMFNTEDEKGKDWLGFLRNLHFSIWKAPFKLTATTSMLCYSTLLFLVIGLKKFLPVFLAISPFADSQIQTCMNLHGGRVKKGSVQYKRCRSDLFISNAGEPKGRDVSEGLIGSDTAEKLRGLWHVLSSVTYKECENIQAGRQGKFREGTKMHLMIEAFDIRFLSNENLAEKKDLQGNGWNGG